MSFFLQLKIVRQLTNFHKIFLENLVALQTIFCSYTQKNNTLIRVLF